MFRAVHGLSQLERPPMERKYLFFHTARAAVFQFYALVALLLSLFCIKLALDVPEANVVAGVLLYSGVVVFYSFHIDRKYRGNRGL